MATRATTATANTTTTERLRRFSLIVVLVVPGIFLGIFGFVHFKDGLAVDAAVPVPVYMVAQISVPKKAYVEAAEALSEACQRNGGAMLSEAEARIHGGEPASVVLPLLRNGLSHEPASARGWTLLAEILHSKHPAWAAQALNEAFLLSPRDTWIAGARAQDAALLWPYLDDDTRGMAVEQTRRIWQEPLLRLQILGVVDTPQGAALVTRSFGQGDIRAINRWVRQERRRPR